MLGWQTRNEDWQCGTESEKCLLLLHIFWMFDNLVYPVHPAFNIVVWRLMLESIQTEAILKENLQYFSGVYVLPPHVCSLNNCTIKPFSLQTHVFLVNFFRYSSLGRQTRGSQRHEFKQNVLYLLRITCNGQCWKYKEISVLFPTKSFSGYSF